MTVDQGAYMYCSAVADSEPIVGLRSPVDMQNSPREDWPYVVQEQEPTPRQWSEFFQRNAVQRIVSAAILAPAVTAFLWLSPAFATTTGCSFMISTCAYEYACLANRIRLRILTQMEALEGALNDSSSGRRCGNNTSLFDDRILSSIESAASSSANSSAVRTRFSQPDARAAEEEHEDREIAIVDDELRDQEDRIHRCAVTSLAVRHFDGRVWWAAAFVSVPVCALTSTGFLLSVQWVSDYESTEFYTYRWFFALPTGYVVALCACLTPDWQYAVITLVKYGVFTTLTLHSTVPMR
ncbi:hypothetical protein PF005_g15122 [Phytophthora fragariae]|uniref:Transmembrane protein n=1 Tax=Phytophthora fragariae TaxID=53985 RepID=A0A6A3RMY2_9STRA|nr:hypothetical protein PF003_g12562 [Phytophthora fragariae]KAE8933549.1 hypothetical protein PF009_g16435 [Phytophthora fragariae]KAE9100581.1 hypothetical protein PF007_g15459 [Phytophthora fragariae]KAE9100740.1 hypothetical protein PF010_g14715 [Phytophthora fragariae]KAE9137218.1 hypothetical protein PF006_g14235 [Phytophthora fragariae]